mmetsp:Transcript_51342/g.92522  ORF Transcript_51342/g.92522 Transcript_51342/m.92522 type:complete len:251 (+) Transcript_51342:355-1107(+)
MQTQRAIQPAAPQRLAAVPGTLRTLGMRCLEGLVTARCRLGSTQRSTALPRPWVPLKQDRQPETHAETKGHRRGYLQPPTQRLHCDGLLERMPWEVIPPALPKWQLDSVSTKHVDPMIFCKHGEPRRLEAHVPRPRCWQSRQKARAQQRRLAGASPALVSGQSALSLALHSQQRPPHAVPFVPRLVKPPQRTRALHRPARIATPTGPAHQCPDLKRPGLALVRRLHGSMQRSARNPPQIEDTARFESSAG